MSQSPFRIRRTETAKAIFDRLSPEGQAQICECFEVLAKNPSPGPESKVVRLRSSPPTPAPTFCIFTKDYGVIFTVDHDVVEILALDEHGRV